MSYLRYVCLFVYCGVQHTLTIHVLVTWRVSYKMEGILALRRWLDPPVFGGVLLLIFLVFCALIFASAPDVASFSGLSILDYPFGFL